MRGLLWVMAALAALWGGWWVIGARGAKTAAEAWFADQITNGIEASYDDLSIAGFPNRFDLTITQPKLADPQRDLAWSAPFAQVLAMSWKPWHLIAALPGGQVFTLGGQQFTLDGDTMKGSLLLVPGTDLALSEAVIEGEALRLTGATAVQAVNHLVLSARADLAKNSYRFGLIAKEAELGPAFGAGDGPGGQISLLRLDGHTTFSAPLDRHVGLVQPHLTGLTLQGASLDWGKMRMTAEGDLTPDSAGYASGTITLHVTGWRHLPPVLVAAGLITADFAPVLTRGFEVLAAQGATPDQLDIALTAAGGQMALGPLPLGPAPWWGQ